MSAERRARLRDDIHRYTTMVRSDDLLALLDMVDALERRLAATERVALDALMHFRLSNRDSVRELVDAELAKEAGDGAE